MRTSLLAFCAVLFAASPAMAADATASWPATCKYPNQGEHIPGVVGKIDCDVATAVYPGNSVKPIELPYGAKRCWFIDSTRTNTLFVPLKTEAEWTAFYNRFMTDSSGKITITECDTACTSDKPIISFVIDESGSIGASNFNKVKSFFSGLIDGLDYTGTEPSNSVFFSSGVNATSEFKALSAAASALLKANMVAEKSAKVGKNETEKKAIADEYKALRDKIRVDDGVPTKASVVSHGYRGGWTAMAEALYKSAGNMKDIKHTREGGAPSDKMIVLFTDGYNNYGENSMAQAAAQINSLGIKTFVIGVGNSLNTTELNNVAKAGLGAGQAEGSNYRTIDSFADMAEAVDMIAKTVCATGRK